MRRCDVKTFNGLVNGKQTVSFVLLVFKNKYRILFLIVGFLEEKKISSNISRAYFVASVRAHDKLLQIYNGNVFREISLMNFVKYNDIA